MLVAPSLGWPTLRSMDPLTQAGLGAAAAAIFSRRNNIRTAIVVGALAGAAPDLDVLIRSQQDPLLSLEYHRHFSHALLVAPLIGLVVAYLYRLIFRYYKFPFRELAIFGIAGALTHGLLDACTSYGTRLYWPFSQHRESWDMISIIDPIFTLPLLALTVLAFALRWPAACRVALVLCFAYFGFGIVQRERAQHFAQALAAERGHRPQELTARPSFGNTILWRTIYREGEEYHVDAVNLLPFSTPKLYPGASVTGITLEAQQALIAGRSILAHDVERFRHFSQGYLYPHPKHPDVLADLRYAMLPDSVDPLWGIRVPPAGEDASVEMLYFRTADKATVDRLKGMLRRQ
ncbi:MAG: inner membrane protein [Lentimonas sp.]